MQKAQVFLRDDQKANLKAIAARTGRKQSELIRDGVDLVIEESQATEQDWKTAWRKAAGMWKDRDDIEEIVSEGRAQMNQRFKSIDL